MKHAYDKEPSVRVRAPGGLWRGWRDITHRLTSLIQHGARVVAIECYPGVFEHEIAQAILECLPETNLFRTDDALLRPAEIEAVIARDLTTDPVFGRMSGISLRDYFDCARLEALRCDIAAAAKPSIVLGTGATLAVSDPYPLIYADMPRWEIQQRQRAGTIGNLGAANERERASLKYKRAYFLDWRAADRLKKHVSGRVDFLLDTTIPDDPKMVRGEDYRNALRTVVNRPFRVKPFFDPGPWGGQWMREICDLPDGPPNYAWCFDCVPEENSLLLDFEGTIIEIPSINLVFEHPRELLGEAVHARFGTEFPIRFDFLDTMQGGNLSLQVHPLTEYIYDRFGMAYTQDESYYMLDAGPDACVYLGLKPNIDRERMAEELRAAQTTGAVLRCGNVCE